MRDGSVDWNAGVPAGERGDEETVWLSVKELVAGIRQRLEDCYHFAEMPDEALTSELIRRAYWDIKDLVEQLMDRGPKTGRLPGGGQLLWRQFQSAVNTLDPRDDSPFLIVLDHLDAWLADFNPDGLQSAPAVAPSPGPGPAVNGRARAAGCNRKTRNDAEAQRRREDEVLRRALGVYHSGSARRDTPITQRELASALGWPQARVSRVASRAFPEGWNGYLAAFRTGGRRGFMQVDGEGRGQPDGIVVPDGD